MNRDHVDALWAEFVSEVLRDGGDADVAKRGDRTTRAMNGEPSNVDDAAPTIFDQVRRERACRAHVANDLDVDVFQRLRVDDLSQLGGGRDAARQRRVVDEDVDATE